MHLLGEPLGRRSVLGAMALGVVSACSAAGSEPAARPSRAASSTAAARTPKRRASALPQRTPLTDLRFTEVARFHRTELVSPAFTDVTERPGRTDRLVTRAAEHAAPFLAVEALLSSGDPGVGSAVLGLGSADGRTALRAVFDLRRRRVLLEVVTQGRVETVADKSLPQGATHLGFALCERRITALVGGDDGDWRAIATERDAVVDRLDPRTPAVLAGLGWTWGARNGTVNLKEVRCGSFGMVGLRDPHLVQNADGTPVTDDGDVFLTWTCAGLGLFGQAHWGVFRLDPERPDQMHQVAHLFTRRDGLLLGDHAGQLVRDGDRWLVVTSSWGDFDYDGVHVRACETTADLMTGVHVLETERVNLPSSLSTWDPGMTKVDGEWVFTYVESPSQRPFVFYPAVARTRADRPWVDLRPVAALDQLRQTEGPIVVHGPAWRILASDGDARQYRIFDLDLQEIGRLDAPYGTNIPHPQLVPLADGGWLMTTFDGTDPRKDVMGYGGHGDAIMLRAAPA